jgi:hypothetical protein
LSATRRPAAGTGRGRPWRSPPGPARPRAGSCRPARWSDANRSGDQSSGRNGANLEAFRRLTTGACNLLHARPARGTTRAGK